MNKYYYITTPIYYVNDLPHIGHAYTTLACDILARFNRLSGKEVFFLTGTDEHGQKIEKAAQSKDMQPKAFVDSLVPNFKALIETMNCSPNDFIRTSEERHISFVQNIWTQMVDAGQIYLGKYAGWYAVRDEAFYKESDLVDGKAPTGADVEWLEEESYFFRLSQWQGPLLQFYEDHPDFIAPEGRRNEVVSFVRRGLHDLSVSRSTFSWGIKVPNDEKHIIYVWLDALFNYISALSAYDNHDAHHKQTAGKANDRYHTRNDPSSESSRNAIVEGFDPKVDGAMAVNTAVYEQFWPSTLHIIGKDILIFHAVYWPAFLMSLKIPPPKKVFAHGWWLNEGQKISKSLGNIINPFELIEEFGVDYIRYFLMREIPFGNDGSYSREALIQRINSELANNMGNLVQRALVFIWKNCDGLIEKMEIKQEADQAILDHGYRTAQKMTQELDKQAIQQAIGVIIEFSSLSNAYIDHQAPWSLKKQNETERMKTVLYVLAECIRIIGVLLQPFIPESAKKILANFTKLNGNGLSAEVTKNELIEIDLETVDSKFALESQQLSGEPVVIFKKLV